MTKQKMIYLGVGILIGVVVANKARQLPGVKMLPEL